MATTKNNEGNKPLTLKQKHQKVSALLMNYEEQFKQALPKFLTAERLIRVALTAMGKNPKLLDCDQRSLISCLLTSAQLGLMPDGVLGEAYLIPFNNTRKGIVECTFIIGYRGLIALALRSGQVKSISSVAVYEGDRFEYALGLEEKLIHEPKGVRDASKITHFYSIVRLLNGGVQWHVMTAEEVNSIRDKSANYKFATNKAETVWGQYYDEMGRKTVVRSLMKYVPLSPEINKAIGLDDEADVGIQNTSVELLAIDDDLSQSVYEDIEEAQIEEEQQAEQDKANEYQSKSDNAVAGVMDKINAKGKDDEK